MTKAERQKLAKEKFYAKYGSQAEYNRQWRAKNPERVSTYSRTSYLKHKQTLTAKQKRYRRSVWLSIVEHYGQRCACCGVTQIEFLTIDHKNNDGNLHRQAVGLGHAYWRHIVNSGYPDYIQILCWNCNRAKGCFLRRRPNDVWICPHKLGTMSAREDGD